MKITKKEQQSFIRTKLTTDRGWATRALLVIFNNQTEDEKATEQTVVENGIGFTGVDAQILTSFARQYTTKGYLSPKQYNLLFKKIGKYWRQILAVSDEHKLNALILKNRERA